MAVGRYSGEGESIGETPKADGHGHFSRKRIKTGARLRLDFKEKEKRYKLLNLPNLKFVTRDMIGILFLDGVCIYL